MAKLNDNYIESIKEKGFIVKENGGRYFITKENADLGISIVNNTFTDYNWEIAIRDKNDEKTITNTDDVKKILGTNDVLGNLYDDEILKELNKVLDNFEKYCIEKEMISEKTLLKASKIPENAFKNNDIKQIDNIDKFMKYLEIDKDLSKISKDAFKNLDDKIEFNTKIGNDIKLLSEIFDKLSDASKEKLKKAFPFLDVNSKDDINKFDRE